MSNFNCNNNCKTIHKWVKQPVRFRTHLDKNNKRHCTCEKCAAACWDPTNTQNEITSANNMVTTALGNLRQSTVETCKITTAIHHKIYCCETVNQTHLHKGRIECFNAWIIYMQHQNITISIQQRWHQCYIESLEADGSVVLLKFKTGYDHSTLLRRDQYLRLCCFTRDISCDLPCPYFCLKLSEVKYTPGCQLWCLFGDRRSDLFWLWCQWSG